MKAQRPYLLRALHEWLIDSGDVPYILVDATVPEIQVPQEHIQDGQIVLNLGPDAVVDLVLEQDYVMCNSRFGGRAFELYLPMHGIRAIYGRDTRQGMVFPDENLAEGHVSPAGLVGIDATGPAAASPDPASPGKQDPSPKEQEPGDKPTLRLV